MRFVIDTNLLVSAIVSPGLPPQLLDAARAGDFEFCTSEVVLAELLDVISRGKFTERLALAGLTPEGLVEDLRRLAIVVMPNSRAARGAHRPRRRPRAGRGPSLQRRPDCIG